MRIIVCGGRDYDKPSHVQQKLAELRPGVVIQGGCPSGADLFARRWAHEHGVSLVSVPAEWKKHGRKAGPLRNQAMLDYNAPDLVLAFPGGKGTADMVRRAKKAGVQVIECN